MAVGSRDERFSLMGLALPAGFPLGNPVAGISASDRRILLMLYAGISLGEEANVAAAVNTLWVAGEQRSLGVDGESRTLQVVP